MGDPHLDEPLDRRSGALRGLKDALPIMLGFVPFALVLGAQAAQKGLTKAEVPLMTGLNFAGGSEFSAVSLWASPPPTLLIVGVTLLVNSRHLLMGGALAPYLRPLPQKRAFVALAFMCDESWAVGLEDARRRERQGRGLVFNVPYYLGAALGMWATWVVFTFLGSVLGPRFGDIERYGFGMAFPAVFLVLLRGMWEGWRASRPWLVSLVVAAATHLLVPGAWYVAAGAASGLAAAWLWAGEGES